jgi:1-acyl-sn-glycerol-3-phosphate acyltransferase
MEWFVKFTLRIFFNLFYRVELVNKKNIPANGGAIVCSNHIGELDMFFIAYSLKRLVHYMAKEELFKNPISSWFFYSVGAFPIKRGTGDIASIKTVLKMLGEGKLVGILPEGHRTRGKDRSQFKPKAGAAMLAIKGNVPIIPVGIKATYKLFSKVKVVFGEPYYIQAEKGRKYTGEELTEFSVEIMDKVYSLLEEK